MDNLMKIHNNNNNNNNNNNTIETIRDLTTTESRIRREPTTGRRMTSAAHGVSLRPDAGASMRMTEEQINHLKKVRLRVAELKQRTDRIINQQIFLIIL